jgi:REP element-mobilizing transposase RayT
LEILATNSELHGVEVRAYVLMENHFHLVLMTVEANLKNFMQRFNTTGIGGI